MTRPPRGSRPSRGLGPLGGLGPPGGLGPLGGLGPPGPLGPTGPVISLGYRTWGYPHGSRNGVGPGRPPRLPGQAGPKEHFTSGYFSPVRGPAFSLGSQATPGIHRHPYGFRGIFRVRANASQQAGTAPPPWWD